jgi:hypothetical protein
VGRARTLATTVVDTWEGRRLCGRIEPHHSLLVPENSHEYTASEARVLNVSNIYTKRVTALNALYPNACTYEIQVLEFGRNSGWSRNEGRAAGELLA